MMVKKRWFYGIPVVLTVLLGSCFLFEADEPESKPIVAAKTYAITVEETANGVITAPSKAVPGSKVAILATPGPIGEVDENVEGGGD
jgi:hypothetical protein